MPHSDTDQVDLDDRLTQRNGGLWEHGLLYLWGRWDRSVALINLPHAVGPTEPPSVPKAALL